MRSLLLLAMFSSLAFASNDLSHRPKSFSSAGKKAVFVDFTEATYNITYDINNKKASAKAVIKFNAPEAGYPIFDSVTAPSTIALDGASVTATETKTPNNETTLRVIDQMVTTGSHSLVVTLPIEALVEFKEGGVKSAFWTSDLSERNFLERYLPANFEFDQVKMTFNIEFIGGKSNQNIYTNGVVKAKNKNQYSISYPEHYTASSIFFHTVPATSVDEIRYTIKSIDGRTLPVVIYTGKSPWGGFNGLERLKERTNEIIQELESDYGPFPHPSITVYNAGAGGMEYCGATMTSASALGHELFHSYFARGVMPANGNAGWLDEALASWRDDGYQSITTLMGSSRMSAHPYYTRTTDRAAYSFGERFMSLLDGKLQSKGGLKPFMRHMVEFRKFSPLHVEEFIREMGQFYGVDVSADFKRYTFGTKDNFKVNTQKSHSVHRKMTLEELKNYL